ncbi:MAG: insulinase family protein [Lentisphaerae bacterium]|nr:insulinase family protein [Lentisphaerota bacterium]
MILRPETFIAACLLLTLASGAAPAPRKAVRFTLENGLVGLVQEDASAPLVSIQAWFASGSDDEAEYAGSGLTHFIEHMVFKGTPSRKPGEIAKAIDDIGGNINAYTAHDRTVFFAELPADEWRTGLAILADAIQNASFPEQEWEKEREVILRELAMCRDDPDRRIGELLMSTAFRVHPSRFPIIGHEPLFQRLTRDDLTGFYQRRFVPNNMILAVAGAVKPGEIEEAVRSELGRFAPRPIPPAAQPAEPAPVGPRLAREAGPYEIGRIEWAYPAVGLDHPDAPTLDVFATIAGGGDSSRLALTIRDKEKLAHSISAWSYTPRQAGLFGISATFDPANESNLVSSIRREIEEWRSKPFSEAEVGKARRIALMHRISELQTVSGQAHQMAAGEFYAYNPGYSDVYLQRINRVTPADLLAAAGRYLDFERSSIAVLVPASGDASAAASAAPEAGPVIKTMLPGNVPLITREDRRLPLAWICVAVGGGLLHENEGNYGITRLLSELLLKGARGMSAAEIAERAESAGAALSAFSGYNTYGIEVQCLSSDAPEFAALIADCLLHPDFPEDEIAGQKARQAAEIDAQWESPVFLAAEALRGSLFAGHPYRLTPSGTKAALLSLARKDLLAFHGKTLVAGNIALACFGDLSEDQARNLAAAAFKRIPAGLRPAIEHAPPAQSLPARSERSARKEQAIFMAGAPGLDILDPRNDSLLVLVEAMNGLSSDIMTRIRDKEGLAYFVNTFHQEGVEPGFVAVCAGTRSNALPKVESLVMDELARMAGQGPRPDEFERARRQIRSARLAVLQTNGRLARECATDELLGLGFDHSLKTVGRLEKLTPESVRETAASLFQTNRIAISVVFPETPQPDKEDAK